MKYFYVLVISCLLAFSSIPSLGMDAAAQGGTDFTTGQATVTTTASKVIAAQAYPGQRGFVIRNLDATNPIYIGHTSTVSSTTGWVIKAGESFTVPVQCDIWAISTGASVTINWIAPLY
jgi:hypothetical protein